MITYSSKWCPDDENRREVQKSLLDAEERLISVRYQTKLAEIFLLQIAGRIMDYIQDT